VTATAVALAFSEIVRSKTRAICAFVSFDIDKIPRAPYPRSMGTL